MVGDRGSRILGIDGSRNRSGGARAHLIGVLSNVEPQRYGFSEVHVWSYKKLLGAIPDRPWLVKHNPLFLERSLFFQMWWQKFSFPSEAKQAGCDLVLNCDAGTISPFQPSVTMSRDLLSYEPGAIERYGISKARLRLILLRHIQNRSLTGSNGAIFISPYAAELIQESSGSISNFTCVYHGVADQFLQVTERPLWPQAGERAIRCVYVSNAALYKHQWEVIRAISELRHQGFDIHLQLVGGGSGRAQDLLEAEKRRVDPDGIFVEQLTFLPHEELPKVLAKADIAIFASSCEALGITLLEKMAMGLPIACSNRRPMSDYLQDGAVYFEPEDSASIATAVKTLIVDEERRDRISARAKELGASFTWSRCADETFAFLRDVCDASTRSLFSDNS